MSDHIDRLKKMDDAYDEAKVIEPGELPPDGDYQARIERFDFFESKKTEQLFLKTFMSIANGEHQGWPVETIHNLEDSERIQWAKKHLKAIGYDGPLSNLEEGLEPIVGTPLEIRIVTSNSTDSNGNHYRNVYINKRLGDPEKLAGAASSNGKGKSSDDDIPFARGRFGRDESTWPTRSVRSRRG